MRSNAKKGVKIMNFWNVLFVIYVFFTITPFLVSLSQVYEIRRLICLKVGKSYYNSFKQSIPVRIIAGLTSFFLYAIPILNFFVTFYLITHTEEIVNSRVQKWLTEHKKSESLIPL